MILFLDKIKNRKFLTNKYFDLFTPMHSQVWQSILTYTTNSYTVNLKRNGISISMGAD